MEKETEKTELKIELKNPQNTAALFGSLDQNLKIICKALGVEIVQRTDQLIISGKNSELAESVVRDLQYLLETGEELDGQKIEYVIALNKQGATFRDSKLNKEILCFTHRGKPIKAKTIGQVNYANSIRQQDIVFGIGPAGTGKTYIAVAMGAQAFKNKEVSKIILARPAVEAGERLGFLPGDLQEKVDPYLRPLYDALYDVLGRDFVSRLKEKESIEVVPLAYMRGRTLDNSFIILDEAQNTTKEQMKMFLTRLGFGSKAVITGDITQIDLPRGKASGLKDAISVLKDVKGIDFCFLKDGDVVRHPLVKRIIQAYDRSSEDYSDQYEGEEVNGNNFE